MQETIRKHCSRPEKERRGGVTELASAELSEGKVG